MGQGWLLKLVWIVPVKQGYSRIHGMRQEFLATARRHCDRRSDQKVRSSSSLRQQGLSGASLPDTPGAGSRVRIFHQEKPFGRADPRPRQLQASTVFSIVLLHCEHCTFALFGRKTQDVYDGGEPVTGLHGKFHAGRLDDMGKMFTSDILDDCFIDGCHNL
jgi:hypothetical protein